MTDAFTPRHLDLHTRPQRLEEPDPRPDQAAEADRRNALAVHRDPSLADGSEDDELSGRSKVQWVRPTDLAARSGAAVLERGSDWNRQLHDTVMDAVRDGRAQLAQRLARRQHELADTIPVSSGRTSAARTAVRR